MASRAHVPDLGGVVWLEFDPRAGHERAGHRPALVMSPAHQAVVLEVRARIKALLVIK